MLLTEDNGIAAQIKRRISMANKTSYGLKKQINPPNMERQPKRMLYKTLTRPILTYGSEFWPSQRRMGICSESLKEEY